MRQTTIARHAQNGFTVALKEIEILDMSGLFVAERRHIVFSKVPGKPIKEYPYLGIDSARLARDQFEFIKSLIELNH
jgi:hypothetical protein